MKIVFVSNYFNHHQKPLCQALHELTGGNFEFIATIPMRQERKALGYGMDAEPEYVIRSYASPEAEKACRERILEADVVIAGSAPEDMIAPAIRRGILVFRYSERPLKQGQNVLKYIPRLIRWHLRNPWRKSVYLLCASAYAAGDYAQFGLFRSCAYRWGYFTETKTYTPAEELFQKKDSRKILWVARFLSLKHPEQVLSVAEQLLSQGYDFQLDFIGGGEEEASMRERVRQSELEDRVNFLGTMKPDQVRSHMERAGIFLFTSDKREGWGAVVNEAMNSGCAVVASHAAGSAPYLINHGQNGLLYPSGDSQRLYEQVKALLESPREQTALGRRAYETIVNTWNAREAAKRLLELSERILAGEKSPVLYGEGPCSLAPLLHDDWM